MIFLIGFLSMVSVVLFIIGLLLAIFGIGATGSDKPVTALCMAVVGVSLVAISF